MPKFSVLPETQSLVDYSKHRWTISKTILFSSLLSSKGIKSESSKASLQYSKNSGKSFAKCLSRLVILVPLFLLLLLHFSPSPSSTPSFTGFSIRSHHQRGHFSSTSSQRTSLAFSIVGWPSWHRHLSRILRRAQDIYALVLLYSAEQRVALQAAQERSVLPTFLKSAAGHISNRWLKELYQASPRRTLRKRSQEKEVEQHDLSICFNRQCKLLFWALR